jgi:hypothetical protein
MNCSVLAILNLLEHLFHRTDVYLCLFVASDFFRARPEKNPHVDGKTPQVRSIHRHRQQP